jgi:hypothetical protein
LIVFLAAIAAAAADAPPAAAAAKPAATCAADVPDVPGVDQSPSDPADYGRCTDALDSHVASSGSNWCAFGAGRAKAFGAWPAGPSPAAKRCLKFGRMTVYRGPLYGSEPRHRGACNVDLVGSNESAVVAVSTKYLKTEQHGWAEDKGSCGKCMCVHIR